MFLKDDRKHDFEDFEKDIQFKNNPYVTKLPIRKSDDILSDNYVLANNRLINLEKQLDRNKKRFSDYDKVIQDYVKEGILERTDHIDNNTILGRVHYLLHREDHNTTRLRIVFEASAKIRNELSLTLIWLDFFKVVFPGGGGQFPPTPSPRTPPLHILRRTYLISI